MAKPDSTREILGGWTKRKFLKASVIGFGLPAWVISAWAFRDFYTSSIVIAYLGVLSLGAGYMWGLGMWHFFQSQSSFVDTRKDKDNAT